MTRTLTLAALSALIAMPAVAQEMPCGNRAEMVETLASQFKEYPIGAGIERRGTLAELFVTKDGSTWTLLSTLPDGRSCIVGTGEHWRAKEQIANGPEA